MHDQSWNVESRAVLEPGETVLWRGKPRRGAWIWQGYPLFLFGLLWFGFAIFWNCMVWRQAPAEGMGVVMRLWGLPFLVVGFYITFGQLLQHAWEWPRVEYLVTDKRLITLSGLLAPRQTSQFLDTLVAVDLRYSLLDRRGATGTIVVDAPPQTRPAFPLYWGRMPTQAFQFMAIPDAADVLHTIYQARERVRGTR